MAKSPASELIATLRSYFNQLTEGERTPSEVANALNDWARESAESIRAKVGEEVEASVSKMGFVKREEYDLLAARVRELEKSSSVKSSQGKSSAKKAPAKKAPAKKAVTKKATAAKSSVKKASK